jgi:hypothetical protein
MYAFHVVILVFAAITLFILMSLEFFATLPVDVPLSGRRFPREHAGVLLCQSVLLLCWFASSSSSSRTSGPADSKTSRAAPRVINVDKNASYPKAIAQLKASGVLPASAANRALWAIFSDDLLLILMIGVDFPSIRLKKCPPFGKITRNPYISISTTSQKTSRQRDEPYFTTLPG